MQKLRYKISYSLLSMLFAWLFGYLIYVIYQLYILNRSRVEDGVVILSWSAIFCFISVVSVVPIVIAIANKFVGNDLIFVLLLLLASFVIMTILPFLLFGFYPSDMGWYAYIHASIVSIVFGLIYLKFNRQKVKYL